MKHTFIHAILFCTLLFTFPGNNLFANQRIFGDEAAKIVAGADEVVFNEDRNTVSFIHFAPTENINVENHLIWLSDFLKTKGDNTSKLVLLNTEKDMIGGIHYRYQQVYKGVAVEWSRINVHTNANRISSINM